eukprot:g23113.t1
MASCDGQLWSKALQGYGSALRQLASRKQDPSKLEALDEWFQKTEPKKDKAYLLKVLESRPTDAGRPWRREEVKRCFQAAYDLLAAPDADGSKAVKALTSLQGVGPVTASALLCRATPQRVAYMSDEAVLGSGLFKRAADIKLACFRDDIIFFIYIYQRWKYRVDKNRPTSWGGQEEPEEPDHPTLEGKKLPAEESQGVEEEKSKPGPESNPVESDEKGENEQQPQEAQERKTGENGQRKTGWNKEGTRGLRSAQCHARGSAAGHGARLLIRALLTDVTRSEDCKNPSAALMVRINGSAGHSSHNSGLNQRDMQGTPEEVWATRLQRAEVDGFG